MDKFESGSKRKQSAGYEAFVPRPINRRYRLIDPDLQRNLSQADRFLGRLDSFSNLIDIDFYVRMHVTKEATLSSRIEGTQTNVREAVMNRADLSPERRDDWEEVQNYIVAMQRGNELLEQLPFSSRLIRQLHATLMQGVRGQHKQPGEYRRSQNWIGGRNLAEARFVPPPHTEVENLMSDLEKFANDHDNPLPDLLKIALIHYQFETIHPFLDGNGRVGRLLITLYLVEREILQRPILYLSAYFERNRSDYYDYLTRVRTKNDLNGWLNFFLQGVIETARSGVDTFNGIQRLSNDLDDRVAELRGPRSERARLLIRHMLRSPIVDATQVQRVLDITPTTTYRLLADLQRLNILHEITGGSRNRLFELREYLDLFQ